MTNKNRKIEIESRVLEFLKDNKNSYFSLKELSQALQLRKHEYKSLQEVMNKLKRDNDVILKNRQFGIKTSPQSQKVEGVFDAGSLVRGYSYAFVNCPSGDIFIDSEDISNAYHGDKVLVEIRYKRRGLLYGRIVKVKRRANNFLTGNIDHYQGKYYFLPDLAMIHTTFQITDLRSARKGEKVLLQIENWGDRENNKKPAGKVTEILGKAGNTRTEELALIKQFDLPLEFPRDVNDEVSNLDDNIDDREIRRREDFRNITTITIDPSSAKDYDDAISLEITDDHYVLYVHIADVTHYVRPGNHLFEEAVKRGNSFYFPRSVIPMLPEKLSNKICSLRPDEDKLTLSVVTRFDRNYNIEDQYICESLIRSSARLNYDEVDNIFEGRKHTIPEEIVHILKELRKLSQELSSRRYARGYIPFDMPDTEFEFDDEGNISAIKRSRETESHKLIENCMLLANEYTAELLHKKGKRSIYRIHENPDEDSVRKILDLLSYYRIKYKKNQKTQKLIQGLLTSMPNEDYHRVFDPIILRSMKKARYDTEPIGHFGLAIKYYTHFTSPIRRVCDLAVHHLIRQHIWKQKYGDNFQAKTVREIAERASEQESLADNAERETSYQFKKLYMKDKVGENYQGLVVNMNNNNMIVELNDLPVSGIIPLSSLKDDKYNFYSRYMELIGKRGKRVFRLMDKLTVKLERIEFDLVFSLVE